MCDYSLHAHANRLAAEGETLITTRFPGGSMGLAAPCEARQQQQAAWDRPDAKPLVAVCIPPGAQLLLEDIPARLRQEFSIRETELVTFTQLGFEAYTHRDGVRLENGRELLLQRLNENQRVRILSLANAAERQETIAATSLRAANTPELINARTSLPRRCWNALRTRFSPQRAKEPLPRTAVPAGEFAHER
jgi:hypothetical protein